MEVFTWSFSGKFLNRKGVNLQLALVSKMSGTDQGH